jgi:hypothetical protein
MGWLHRSYDHMIIHHQADESFSVDMLHDRPYHQYLQSEALIVADGVPVPPTPDRAPCRSSVLTTVQY